jgi:hypothetical protein
MTQLKTQLIEIVREFREAFQLKQYYDAAIHYRLTLEETDELVDGLFGALFSKSGGDFTSLVADALADRVFTACGGIIDGNGLDHYLDKTINWADLLGIDLLRATETVFTSNMSKLATLDSITSTRNKYAKIGVEVDFQPVDESDHTAGFRVICAQTVIGEDGKEYPAGKLLKSTDYKEPDWSYLGGSDVSI